MSMDDDIQQFIPIMQHYSTSSDRTSCQVASGAISTNSSNMTMTSNTFLVPEILLPMHCAGSHTLSHRVLSQQLHFSMSLNFGYQHQKSGWTISG